MSDYKDLYERIALNQMVSFFLYGVEDKRTKNNGCESKINSSSTELMRKIQDLNLDKSVNEELIDCIFKVIGEYEEVYTAIGIKMGVRMLFQLICEDGHNNLHNCFENKTE